MLLYDLVRSVINKENSLENFLHIMEAMNKEYSDFLKKNLVEVLWILGFGLEKKQENKDLNNPKGVVKSDKPNYGSSKNEIEVIHNYSNIVNSLIKHKIVSKTTFIELFDEANLVDCGLIQDQDTFIKQISRLNTKMIYEQQKYNLLREESEGFAKLIFLLFEVKFTKENINKYIDKIFSLIGFFDLDPNRVLDITLSAFETDCKNLCFLEIIKLLNLNALPHILGFKLSNLHITENINQNTWINQDPNSMQIDKPINPIVQISSNAVENNLFEVTAQLIKSNLLDVKKLIPHLNPNIKETEEIFIKNNNDAQKLYATIHTRIAKDLTYLSGNYMMLNTNNQNTSSNNQENLNSSTIPNYFVNFTEYMNENLTSYNNHQFYKLLKYLIKVKSWENCDLIYGILENFYDPIGSSELVMEVCRVLNQMITPLYRKSGLEINLKIKKLTDIRDGITYSNKSFFEGGQVKIINNSELTDKALVSFQEDYFRTPEEFLIRLPKILKFTTLGLGFDQILFQKILKLIKYYSKIFIPNKNSAQGPKNYEYQSIIIDLICKVFLPATSIIDPNPLLLNELWEVINLFEYNKRYKIYNYWQNYLYGTHPILYLKNRILTRETSKWQNTFSKENQKSHGRILGILTNSNPVIIFDKIIKPLTSYDNQIDIIIKALSFASNLSYDVISYVICKTLTDSSREKLDMNFGDLNNWFKNFCYFVGNFYKEYQNVDFSCIFHYLVNQLKNKNQNCYIEFIIIKEIIEKMSMIFTQESLDESQIQSSFGGIFLYLEAMDITKDYKNLNKPIQNLLKFFMSDVINQHEKEKIVSKVYNLMNGINKNGSNSFRLSEDKLIFSDMKQNLSSKNIMDEVMEEAGETSLNINTIHHVVNKEVNENGSVGKNIKNSNSLSYPNNHNKSSKISFVFILLMLLGIKRSSIIFNSNYTQTKLLGYLYDKIQFIFIQLMQFLTTHLEREDFRRILPSYHLDNYVINYKCQPEVVFYLVRNSLKPIYEMETSEYNMWISQFAGVLNEYNKIFYTHFDDNFDPIYLNKAKFMKDYNKNIWDYISPELFFIFSSLQLKDVYLPKHRYENEIDKIQKKIANLQEENANRSISESQIRKNKKEINKLQNSIINLKREISHFTTHQENITKFLEKKNSTLLADVLIDNKRDISRLFIQHCLYPRLIFSSTEALYASKMLIMLINIKMHNINYFDIMQKFIKFLIPSILTVTEFEALNIGYFLLEFLKVVKYWQDEKVWNEECYSNPCFSRNLNTPSSVEHSEFKKVVVCLLMKMKDSFINILKYNDYMSCRNVIIVLNSIKSVYPTSKEIGNAFITAINDSLEKFSSYENLLIMMKRYRDIIINKLPNLPSETNELERSMENQAIKVDRERKRSKHRENREKGRR